MEVQVPPHHDRLGGTGERVKRGNRCREEMRTRLANGEMARAKNAPLWRANTAARMAKEDDIPSVYRGGCECMRLPHVLLLLDLVSHPRIHDVLPPFMKGGALLERRQHGERAKGWAEELGEKPRKDTLL